MTTTIRAQLLALRTLRSTYAVGLSVLAFVAFIVTVDLTESAGTSYLTPAQLREPLLTAGGALTPVVLSIFAALTTAGEYRHRTLSLQLIAAPQRLRTFRATAATNVIVGLVIAIPTLALGTAISIIIATRAGLTFGFPAQSLLIALVAVALFSLLGASLGIICRSQPAALGILVGWFFVEQLARGFLGDASAYLPYALLDQLMGRPDAVVTPAVAGVALAAITAAITAVAAVLFTRRDVM